MNLYGSRLWYNAVDNTDKVAVVMKSEAIDTFIDLLEKSDLNYFGYENGKKSKISISRGDLDIVRDLVGETVAGAMKVEEISKTYTPPEKNVFGTIDYKYIPNKSKKYMSGETKLEQKAMYRTAELLSRQGIKFSGRAYEDKITLTVNENDLEKAEEIYNTVRENLNSAEEKASKNRFDSSIADILENMVQKDFMSEQIPDYEDLIRELSRFQNVDFFDYVSHLNPKFTIFQN